MVLLITSSMFSMRLQSLMAFAMLCACAESRRPKNGSAYGRTFFYYDSPGTEVDLTQYMDPDSTEDTVPVSLGPNFKNTSGPNITDIISEPNATHIISRPNITDIISGPSITTIRRKRLSVEARLFLTGPISTIIIPSFYTVVCLISVPVNICALLILARRIRPKKPAAIYMLNLASADLLFAMLLPFKIFYHFNGNDWIFGDAMCRVVTTAFYLNMYCSVLLIALISVDRLLAVVYPINSLSWRSPRNATIACLAMWVLSFAGSVQPLTTEQTLYLAQLNITTCHDIQPFELFWAYRIYFIVLCGVLFFLPLIVTMVSYTWVIMSLTRRPPGAPGSSRKRRRVVVTVLTVLVMFLLCFTPTNVFLLLQQLQFIEGDNMSREASDSLYVMYLMFLCLGSLNCLLDPLVYYFGSSQCQRELSSLLRCQGTSKGTISSSMSSYDPSRLSCRTLLKSSHKESSKTNTPPTKMDSLQASLSSQYKKLLI